MAMLAQEKLWSWTCFIHTWRLKRKRGFISTALCWMCIESCCHQRAILSYTALSYLFIHPSVLTDNPLNEQHRAGCFAFCSSLKLNVPNDCASTFWGIHRLKQSMPKRKAGKVAKSYDPIAPVAEEISEEACVLCFDEFQVTDIADAMILKQLFENLFLNGVVVVATSNRPPEDLYKNGLQRVNFVPFIAVLQKHCQTLRLDSGIDYRKRNRPSAGKLYFLSSEPDVEVTLDKMFDELALKQNDITRPRVLNVHNRKVRLNKACGTIVDCTFEELCDRPLGASDYLEMSRLFDTVFIRHIPLLTLNKKTQARRLITLVDALYEHKVRVVILAEHPLEDIFVHNGDQCHDESHILMDDLGLKREEASTLSIFSGEEERFAFQRTVSRLTEMQTEEYWVEGDRSTKSQV
uniref:AFG1 like ATPase a isoform X2 n=1 Tax=Monopterus albus TaxID=43700 RepID=UPI0009B32225|nr:lactation elevated protein 1-like isoform X2 [Monopterus albus]